MIDRGSLEAQEGTETYWDSRKGGMVPTRARLDPERRLRL